MPEPGEIRMITIADELHACPACGYALGFHTSFIHAGAGKDNPIRSTRDVFRVILICPECGARFDAGWRISFSEFESRFVRTPAVSVLPVRTVPAPAPAPAEPAALPPPREDHEEHPAA